FGLDTLIPNNLTGVITLVSGASEGSYSFTMLPGFAGATFYSQGFAFDPSVPAGEFTSSNAQRHNL
ncbi:MAG: hypothetical protein KAI24_25825, partial [Planctomycetes bacterium]|nr:hypothetical protein [Planctomycetota bacterium]